MKEEKLDNQNLETEEEFQLPDPLEKTLRDKSRWEKHFSLSSEEKEKMIKKIIEKIK